MIPADLIQKGRFWTKGVQLVDGCTKVSPGCTNCWSEQMTARFNRVPELMTDGKFNGKVQFNLHLLEAAAKAKKPQVYAIWNDLYHEGVTLSQIMEAHRAMDKAKHHTWLIVTKRPERAAVICSGVSVFANGMDVPHHMWHIVTCENQEQADRRIPHLLRIPGKRAIIIEPMQGPVDLKKAGAIWYTGGIDTFNHTQAGSWNKGVHQVILGGETGTNARPMHPDWARSVRDQCAAAGVPFFFKAWGANRPFKRITDPRSLDGKRHNDLAWNKEEK